MIGRNKKKTRHPERKKKKKTQPKMLKKKVR